MPGIVGQATTYNLPNYVGELFMVTPQDTPFLSAIGGLTGGRRADSVRFDWAELDLRAPGNRQRVEGADAPPPEERVPGTAYNIVEIHHEAVEISYTRQAAVGLLPAGYRGGTVSPAGRDVMATQTRAALAQIARDIEYSFIRGSFNDPGSNAEARRTRGILEAITTNVVVADGGGGAADDLSLALLLDGLQAAYESGGLAETDTATLMLSPVQKRNLTTVALRSQGWAESASRNVAGVNLQTLETDFGRLNVMLNRHMPDDTIAIVSMDQCAPVILEIPGKGFLFEEPLAKTGSADRTQIYGEVGLEYGNERAHAKITNLSTSIVALP